MNIRWISIALVAFVGFWLLRMGLASELSGALQVLALVVGFALFIGSAWWLMRGYDAHTDDATVLHNPTLAHFLFESPRSAPLWLGARIFLGYQWVEAGWHKLSNPDWMNGTSLGGYWQRAVTIPEQGQTPITYDWYRDFIQTLLNGGHATWFAPFVAAGEVLVGVGLIVGALVGIAAFFGALMNMSFMLAGSASTNPILFSLAIAMILGWKVAGYIGVDRVLLPMLGAPWRPGTIFTRHIPQTSGSA